MIPQKTIEKHRKWEKNPKMLQIITPCSRPQNLAAIYNSIPKEATWTVVYDNRVIIEHKLDNVNYLLCENTGFVGSSGRNFALDNISIKDEDYILFHDDDNIIHEDLFENIKEIISENKYSIITWGQLNKDKSARLEPSQEPIVGRIDTACYISSWKYNKNVRHAEDVYAHDGIYAVECRKNGPLLKLDKYLCYYNYLR
jgi:hypothetical protein